MLLTAIPPLEVSELSFWRSIPTAEPLQSNVAVTDSREFLLISMAVATELVQSSKLVIATEELSMIERPVVHPLAINPLVISCESLTSDIAVVAPAATVIEVPETERRALVNVTPIAPDDVTVMLPITLKTVELRAKAVLVPTDVNAALPPISAVQLPSITDVLVKLPPILMVLLDHVGTAVPDRVVSPLMLTSDNPMVNGDPPVDVIVGSLMKILALSKFDGNSWL